jgi:TSS9, PorZ, N-terminal beta-propeller domain/Two component regulator propeller
LAVYLFENFNNILSMKLFYVLAFLLVFNNMYAQKIGDWADHLGYQNVVSVTTDGNLVYASSEKALFIYNKNDFSISRLSKANGLSDISELGTPTYQNVKYNPVRGIYLVTYTNGNIDIIQNNKIFNIPDIKDANITGEKSINNIHFKDSFAYLSTTLGIIALDLDKNEIKETYEIGPNGSVININDISTDNQFIYAATELGVYRASLVDGSNLKNFSNWTLLGSNEGLPQKEASNLIQFADNIYANIEDTLFQQNNENWSAYYLPQGYSIRYLSAENQNLVITEIAGSNNQVDSARIGIMQPGGNIDYPVTKEFLGNPIQAIQDEEGIIWIGDLFRSLIRFEDSANNENIYPNGPGSANVFDMDFNNGTLWVAPGAIDGAYNYRFLRDGFFSLNNGNWFTYNSFNVPLLQDIFDFITVAVNPRTDQVYMGSFYGGIVKIDQGNLSVFDKDNSSLQSPTGDPDRTTVAGLVIDNEDNVWVGNFNVTKPLSVIKPDGGSKAFAFPEGIQKAGEMVIDDFNQKWVIIPRDPNAGIVVFDSGEDIDNTADDRFKVLKKGAGNGNLHSTDVRSIAKDNEGSIWVGTTEGVTIYHCPGSVIDNNCGANRPLVDQDGFLGYLLEAEIINAIKVDGGNRKWIGTNNGAFLMSPDGTVQIEYFNKDNSPLFSDVVLSIEIDDEKGIVYFGTDRGIIAYTGTATTGSEVPTGCKIYPNPVRPDYTGPVTIDDLISNSTVKITDINGNMIYETTALGGRVVWDGKNYNGMRAKSGVYLIFISNKDGSKKDTCKLLFLN